MARIAGRRGRLYVGLAGSAAVAEPVAFLKDWEIDFTVKYLDVTSMGDTNYVYVSSLPDVLGTFNGFYDSSTSQLYLAARDGIARNTYLYADNNTTTDYWYGTALFDCKVKGTVEGSVDISGTWKAAGPWFNPNRGA